MALHKDTSEYEPFLQTDRHDRQTTQYIDNRVTAAHVRVCWTDRQTDDLLNINLFSRQTDTTDRLHSISTTVLDRWIISTTA